MKFVAALTCSLLLSGEALAQTTDTAIARPPRAPAETHDSTSPQKLEPVAIRDKAQTGSRYAPRLNYSALRTPTILRDVPQSVSIVSSQLMKDRGMQSMSDVVAYLPGITIGQGEGNRDHIVLRGNSSTADFFVDGVRDDVQYYRDVYNVERVEALKGPNAMVFGRGGGGGVLNRVMKQAGWTSLRELNAEGGAFGHKRLSADIGSALSSSVAARMPAVFQSSGSFRNGVNLERYGVNPTITFAPPGSGTTLVMAYEHFRDHRTADRGIPSLGGRPFETARSAFFGDPGESFSDARVNAIAATVSSMLPAGATLTNRTRLASYDKFYRNVFPGALDPSGARVTISAYDNATDRRNLFNQTDIVVPARTGRMRHLMLFGTEIGRQTTDNFRTTGYFNGTAASFSAPAANPTIAVPLSFRQSAADADNDVENSVLSVYAQDQIELSSVWQIVAGLRYEIFDIDYLDHRNGSALGRRDVMSSPRVGLVYKPRDAVSLYSSFSVSHLPSSGDQFSSLTEVTAALRPERFTNYELGAKWDLGGRVALSAAAYRLDRSNTRANDPVNPARTVQTGSQRTNGYELDLRGTVTSAWDVVAGVSRQDAFISSATAAAREGARVPLVPRVTASLWNRYQLSNAWAVGAGLVHQARSYAAVDNTVTLPAFTRIDAAAFYSITPNIQAQINIENMFDAKYYPTANNNNNISPGAPRLLRFSLNAGF